jgi:hypothetical protein
MRIIKTFSFTIYPPIEDGDKEIGSLMEYQLIDGKLRYIGKAILDPEEAAFLDYVLTNAKERVLPTPAEGPPAQAGRGYKPYG